MIDWFGGLAQRRAFWFALAAFALFLEGAALYYQYVLEYLPCVVCIHIRMVVAAFAILWIVAGVLPGNRLVRRLVVTGSIGVSVIFVERSWQLLATENGWVIGSCDMTLGLPEWIAVDRWMPWLFEIHEPCGVTPYIIAKISMAEVLMANSVLFALLFIAVALLAWLRTPKPA
ncbi:MAG: disulfide bond formation protein B [Pseudomonadota bacterium]